MAKYALSVDDVIQCLVYTQPTVELHDSVQEWLAKDPSLLNKPDDQGFLPLLKEHFTSAAWEGTQGCKTKSSASELRCSYPEK